MFHDQVTIGCMLGKNLFKKIMQWKSTATKFYLRSIDKGILKASVSVTESSTSRFHNNFKNF